MRVPKGSPGLKFEDTDWSATWARRRARLMRQSATCWVVMPANAGGLLLFESWLRHEVAANTVNSERVSISFNYGWG